MKRVLVCLLALMLADLPAFGGLFSETSAVAEAETAPPVLSGGRLEGEGFASAEEAVTAYLQAMKENDVAGMLSTFAIETYVDNLDARAYLARNGTFGSSSQAALAATDPYMRQIAVASRYADLADGFWYQYITAAWPEEYGEYESSRALLLSDNAAVEEFLSLMDAAEFSTFLQEMDLTGFVSPATFSEYYQIPGNMKVIASMAEAYGCDELADVVACVESGGEEYYQFMYCARYGNLWYNLSLGGYAANFLGVYDFFSGGLVPVSALVTE